MSNDIEQFRKSMLDMMEEVDQASRSLSAISDLAWHFLDSSARDNKFENSITDTFWVVDLLANHQRGVMEKMETSLRTVTAIEVCEA